MSAYAARASAIQAIAIDLRRRLELTSVLTVADKMSVINVGIEIVNKILYSFLVSQELFENIDRLLNNHYRQIRPDAASVNRVFYALVWVVRRVEETANQWVSRYTK